jgi:hypothetical protein
VSVWRSRGDVVFPVASRFGRCSGTLFDGLAASLVQIRRHLTSDAYHYRRDEVETRVAECVRNGACHL